jgi:NADH-quinone oxidoreductase subunit J
VHGLGAKAAAVVGRDGRPRYSNTKVLGRVVYTQYVYAVEIAAVILLGRDRRAIALTLRKRKETKYQNPSQQINIRARGPRAAGEGAGGQARAPDSAN